jgi:hypothetical protein
LKQFARTIVLISALIPAITTALVPSVLLAQAQGPDLRAQLAAIDYRKFHDLDDYISRCQQVRVLLPLLDSFYRDAGTKLERLRTKYRDDPQLSKMGDFYAALNKMDQSGLAVLSQEMAFASQLSTMPLQQRRIYFDQKIVPLQRKEDSISNQEVQIAINAKRSGIPLPPDIDRSLSEMK